MLCENKLKNYNRLKDHFIFIFMKTYNSFMIEVQVIQSSWIHKPFDFYFYIYIHCIKECKRTKFRLKYQMDGKKMVLSKIYLKSRKISTQLGILEKTMIKAKISWRNFPIS